MCCVIFTDGEESHELLKKSSSFPDLHQEMTLLGFHAEATRDAGHKVVSSIAP